MPSSYQDVDWGYGNDAPVTEDPLPIWALDQHLARMGYHRNTPTDPYAPPSRILHWEKDGAPPITLAAPQFKAEGYDNLVYDLYDIRDMLKHLNSDGMAGHELVAKKRKQVQG
jgi:hypothetical protein